MTNTDPASTNGWHLDRRLPLALIVTILMQTFGMGYWAATMQSSIHEINMRLGNLETAQGRIADALVSMARYEERQNAILDRLDRLETRP